MTVGLPDDITASVVGRRRELRLLLSAIERGKAVLLISHDLTSIYRLSTRVIALNQGRIIAEGGVDDIRGNPAVIEAYLGT